MMEEQRDLQVQESQKQELVESGAERIRAGLAFVPRVDIYETEDGIMLSVDMPGVSEDSVDITLEKNILTINGYVAPEEPDNYCLVYAEYRVGDYQRSFTISNEVDQGKIEATLKNGVLTLSLPKAVPTTRKIGVSAE
jgi:HSP20 family molecular chaperone IbpA